MLGSFDGILQQVITEWAMASSKLHWPLPKHDYWSTPFAESLLTHLDLRPGLRILDVASGHGIPAFYLAEQVGPTGQVLALDLSPQQVARASAIQGSQLPWLRFDCADVRSLPADLPAYDRVTGNLSVMFFRPNRFETVKGLRSISSQAGSWCSPSPRMGRSIRSGNESIVRWLHAG